MQKAFGAIQLFALLVGLSPVYGQSDASTFKGLSVASKDGEYVLVESSYVTGVSWHSGIPKGVPFGMIHFGPGENFTITCQNFRSMTGAPSPGVVLRFRLYDAEGNLPNGSGFIHLPGAPAVTQIREQSAPAVQVRLDAQAAVRPWQDGDFYTVEVVEAARFTSFLGSFLITSTSWVFADGFETGDDSAWQSGSLVGKVH